MKYIFLILLFNACMTGQPKNNNKVQQNYSLIKTESLKAFPLNQGVYDHAFKLMNNTDWNMKISIPEIKDNQKVPLIIALHWAGGSHAYKSYSDCLAFPALDTLEGIIVAPSSDGLHWINFFNEERVIDLTKKIIKHWPILEDQVIITGYSNGAIGSWQYVKKHPNLFTVAMPVAGMYEASKITPPLYIIHGKEDELFNYKEVERAIKQSIKKGSKIDFQLVNDKSHHTACSYVEALKAKTLKVKVEVLEHPINLEK